LTILRHPFDSMFKSLHMTRQVFIPICEFLTLFIPKSDLSLLTICNISNTRHLLLIVHHTYRSSFKI